MNDYNYSADASDFRPVGTTVVVWTATDASGNTKTCSMTVTVTDDEDPTITCPSNVNQTADAGVCEAAVTVGSPITDDNCSVASVTNDYNDSADASGREPGRTTAVVGTGEE